jgi:hypothetical protein
VVLTFIQLPYFVSDFRRMLLTDGDLRELETLLMQNPGMGKVIPGTGGLRKMRFAPPS